MNIHVKDQELLKSLEAATLVKVEVGSSLYGLNNKESDTDILHLHAQASNLQNSFLWEHHQLQIKESNKDHLFSSIHLFLRNLISGDSCINFEVLHTKEVESSCLNFLYNHKQEFYNYNIVKSYLGLAKRDLKNIIHENGFVNYKKLSHALRSVTTAKAILNKNYDNHFLNYQNEYLQMKSLKDQTFIGDVEQLIKTLEGESSTLRTHINQLLENKQITRALSTEFMQELDTWLEGLVSSEIYTHKSTHLKIDKQIYYQVLEEGLKY